MSDVSGMSNEEWIADHGAFLRRVSLAMLRDECRSEDAAQEAWLASLESPPPRNLLAWLVTVTRRLALRSERESSRRRRREEEAARPEGLPATDSIAARSEIVRLVGEVVADLPEPFRETLLLRYWEDLPPRRISERMGVPVATVQSRTRRGLERMRRELERRAPSEQGWQETLALAVGSFRPRKGESASTIHTTLGALMMKTKSWMAGALALVVLSLAIGVGITRWQPEADPPTPEPTGLAMGNTEVEPLREAAAEGASEEDVGPANRVLAGLPDAPQVEAPTLSVLVLEAAGRPVRGAQLIGGPGAGELRALGRTAADGRTRLELAPDLRVICSMAEGWAPSAIYELPAVEDSAEELVLRLPLRGLPFEVEVRDSRGAPVPRARVFAGRDEEVEVRLPDGTLARTAPGFAATTDVFGVARFSALSPGWLRVAVEHEAFARSTAFATLEFGGDNRVEVVLEAGLTVTGVVRDDRGVSVAGARVQSGSAGRAVTTDVDGAYRLGPVDVGKIVVLGPLGRRVEERVRGLGGSVVRWDPVLPSEPALRGRVFDEQGVALAGWTVHANFDTWPGWRRGTTTDGEGRFILYGTPAGPLRIEVSEGKQDPLPLLVREGVEAGPEEHRFDVAREPGARLTGRVERGDGLPCAELPLFLRHVTTPGRARLTGGAGLAITPKADGSLEIEALPAGRYELVLVGAPFGWFRLLQFELARDGSRDLGRLDVPVPGVLRARSWWGAAEPTGDASYLLERRGDMATVLSFRGSFPEEMRLAPGSYTLQTEVTPGPQREVAFEIEAGQVTEVELELGSTCDHILRVQYASGRVPRGALDLRVRRLDDGALVFDEGGADLDGGAWVAKVELPSGRFEFVARDSAGLEARRTENLYTSRPGREVILILED